MYNKIIRSGNLIEHWNYEKSIIRSRSCGRIKRGVVRTSRLWSNIQRQKKSFYRLVRSNLTTEERPALLTLTMYQVMGVGLAYKCFTGFIKRLRESGYNQGFRYIAVPEFQVRGAVHFHCLIWGFNEEDIINEKKTRAIQSRWLYGFCDITRTDGSPKLAGYLSKYMSKALSDIRLFHKKGYVSSRNIVRPVCLSGEVQTSYQELIGLSTGMKFDKCYVIDTKWLGKCVYKSYIV